MNKLSVLSLALRLCGLTKEAANVLDIPTGEMSDEDIDAAEKEFGKDPISQEEYEQKTIPKPNEFVTLAAKKLTESLSERGITVIAVGDDFGGRLGAGSWGVVYAGLYNGNNVAIKIIMQDRVAGYAGWGEYQKDAENWKAIKIIKESAPEEVKRHIPEVYLVDEGIFEFKTDDIYGSKTYQYKYQLIVLELLSKVSDDITKIMSGYYVSSQSAKEVLNDDTLEEINDLIIAAKLPPISSSVFNKIIINSKSDGVGNNTTSPYDIANYILSSIKVAAYGNDAVYNNKELLPRSYLSASIEGVLVQYLNEAGFGRTFPYGSGPRYTKGYSPTAEVESLYNAIKWLRKKGILWKDVRSENVMVGKDNNLKIVDVGGFKISKRFKG